MKIKSTAVAYFSPTGTTKQIVEIVAKLFDFNKKTYNLLSKSQENDVMLNHDDLLIVGMPVFSGRVPALCVDMLNKFKGNNTPAIITVAFGNRAYDDALLELKNIVEMNGFKVIAAGAFVAQHSIFPEVGAGRPDNDDKKSVDIFTDRCVGLIDNYENLADKTLTVKGNAEYRNTIEVPFKPKGDKKCDACGLCVKICPTKSINSETPRKTNPDTCISCAACIHICPQNARSFGGLLYSVFSKKFYAANSPYKNSDTFYIDIS